MTEKNNCEGCRVHESIRSPHCSKCGNHAWTAELKCNTCSPTIQDGKKCYSSFSIDTLPEQYKCDTCGKEWNADEKTPSCSASPEEAGKEYQIMQEVVNIDKSKETKSEVSSWEQAEREARDRSDCGDTYYRGVEDGMQLARTNGCEHHSPGQSCATYVNQSYKTGYENGRSAALQSVREMLEGMLWTGDFEHLHSDRVAHNSPIQTALASLSELDKK